MHNGFTLIEIMIVIAIIALLAGIGIPSYRDYVMRGQITTATADLADGRIRLEQYFQDNRTYQDNGLNLSPCPANSNLFDYTCTVTASTYEIKAVGKGNVAGFTFTIDQANTKKTTTVPSGWNTSATCWITRKGDSC
jgi:type IV pilus assembly protein PilE